jgi:predicted permease
MATIGGLIGPVAMLLIGMFIAGINWKQVFSTKRTYILAALKMIGYPLVILAFLRFSGLAGLVPNGEMILFISLLAVITPSATSIVQIAQIYGKNAEYAASINIITTLACIITMPLLVMLYFISI